MNTCVDISVRRKGSTLDFDAKRDGDSLSVSTERSGGPIIVDAKRCCDVLSLKAGRRGGEMSFRCSLICEVGTEFYLRVPQENIWLLPENEFSKDVTVYANVNWVIE